MKKIGYARVSGVGQNLARQIETLSEAGCTTIYTEKVSGASVRNRPELAKAINALEPDDVLVFAEWARFTSWKTPAFGGPRLGRASIEQRGQ